MNYQLKTGTSKPFAALRKLMPIIKGERKIMSLAFVALIANTLTSLVVPIIIAHTINTSIISKDFSGVVRASILVFAHPPGLKITGNKPHQVQRKNP